MKRSNRRRAQRGNAAVEFAIIFPLFFLIVYAIITYSLIFAAQQTLTAAVEEGARAALVYQNADSVSAALAARAQNVCAMVKQVVGWLGAQFQANVSCDPGTLTGTLAACQGNTGMQCMTIAITYPYKTSPLIPILPFMGPAVPDELGSQAVVQLDPENLL